MTRGDPARSLTAREDRLERTARDIATTFEEAARIARNRGDHQLARFHDLLAQDARARFREITNQ